MIANKLIDIKQAVIGNLELSNIQDIFKSSTLEFFFWKTSFDSISGEPFRYALSCNSKYYEDILKDGENYPDNNAFIAIRFVNNLLSKDNDLTPKDLESIKAFVNFYIDNYDNNKVQEKNVEYHISEIIANFPLSWVDDYYLSFLKDQALVKNSIVSHAIMDTLLERVLEESNQDLLYILFDYLIFETRPHEQFNYTTVIESYKLSIFLESDLLKKSIELLGLGKISKLGEDRIKWLNDREPYDLSSMRFPSVEPSKETCNTESYPYFIVSVYRTAIDCNDFNIQLVEHLLQSDIDILKRLSIHAMNSHFENAGSFFWSLENPLNNYILKHEVHKLLEVNCASFSEENLLVLFGWIQNMVVHESSENLDKDKIAKRHAYEAKGYLSALTNCNEQLKGSIQKESDRYNEITKESPKNPGFNVYSEFKVGHDYPDNQKDFDKNTGNTHELVAYLLSGESLWSDYEKRGQAERLRFAIRNQPDLISSVYELEKLDQSYLYEVLSGLELAIKNESEIDWSACLNLAEYFISLYNEPEETSKDIWRLGQVAWMIREIGKDHVKIDEESLLNSKDLLLIIINLNIPTGFRNDDDITDIINSVSGKAYESLLALQMRYGRLNKVDESVKWMPDVRECYNEIIKGIDTNKTLQYNLAGHLPQFGYIDIEWVKKNIQNIFNIDNIESYLTSMSFYTRMNARVYGNLFYMMQEHGIYNYGLNLFKDEHKGVSDFIKHVMIVHLSSFKDQELDNPAGLLELVIENNNESQLSEVARFLNKNDGYEHEMMFPIWRRLLSVADGRNALYDSCLDLISKIKNYDNDKTKLAIESIESSTDSGRKHWVIGKILDVRNEPRDIENRIKVLVALDKAISDDYFSAPLVTFTKYAYEVLDLIKVNSFVEKMLEMRQFDLLDVFEKYNKN